MVKKIKFSGGSKSGQAIEVKEGEEKEFITSFFIDKQNVIRVENYRLTTWLETAHNGFYEKQEYKLMDNNYRSKANNHEL